MKPGCEGTETWREPSDGRGGQWTVGETPRADTRSVTRHESLQNFYKPLKASVFNL